MTKVLILYYSTYGHTEAMAHAVAEGVREAGAEAVVKRVPELVPEEVARNAHFKLDQPAPVATVHELPEYDAIVVGLPTRYGRMASQMASFWDQAGSIWASGALTGKVGSVFTSTATQHGGQESTLLTTMNVLLHHGMIIVGLPYSFAGQMRMDEITGGTPSPTASACRRQRPSTMSRVTSATWRPWKRAPSSSFLEGWRSPLPPAIVVAP